MAKSSDDLIFLVIQITTCVQKSFKELVIIAQIRNIGGAGYCGGMCPLIALVTLVKVGNINCGYRRLSS